MYTLVLSLIQCVNQWPNKTKNTGFDAGLSPALLVFAALFTLLITPANVYAQTTGEMPAGLHQAYQQARHKIEVIESRGQPKTWRASNPANHMTLDFDGKGFTARATQDDWRFSMQLTQMGAPNQLKPVKPASVKIKDNRLTYDRGLIKEWYINDPKGMEQGFTLDRPLSKDQLVLQFALGGDVKPTLMGDRQSLQLTTPGGKQLRYEGLKAWDATGKHLMASMGLKDKALQLNIAVVRAVYPITIDPVLVEDQKLVASDAAAGDGFGNSVAVSGDTAVIGAVNNDDGGSSSGSAYIFLRTGTSWSQQAKLVASDAAAEDRFGRSVAVSGDTAVIGARGDDDGGTNSGSAYVFQRTGATWSQQAKLNASDAAAQDNFGFSVAISGNTAVIGASNDDDAGNASGSAYVFQRTGATWSQQAKLVAADAAAGDGFGYSVAISVNTAVIGAYGDDDRGADSGSAYFFLRTGTTWNQQAKRVAVDTEAGDHFGWSVAISGNIAVIGAPHDDDGSSNSAGSASVFARPGGGSTSWIQLAKLMASDAARDDNFGFSVAISGIIPVIGAIQDDDWGSESGSAYAYTLPLAATTLISPSGNITDTTPTYSWHAVTDSTWYQLWVNDSTGNRIAQWLTATEVGCASGTGTCSTTPTTVLAHGAAKWWVQTWNANGYGRWSSAMDFTVINSGPPPAATLISPSGIISDTTPTYTWNAVADSSWYYLWVDDSTGNKIKQWFSAADAGCASGTGTCSITPTTALAQGAAQWWIQTWNTNGFGSWSASLNFTVSSTTPPPAATLFSPSGNIFDRSPTYVWNAVATATWYQLWVDDPRGNKIRTWYSASQVNCSDGTGTCYITPATVLDIGKGRWWIQTWNTNGYGPWSNALAFSVMP